MSNVLSFFFMCNQTYDLGLWRILRRISPEFLANLSKFYLYGMIGGSTLLFTRDNRVFAYGFNGNGRLGVGHFRLDVSGQPEEIEELRNVKIFSVAGADFIVALVEDDNTHKCYLLTWGSNNHGQLGIGDQEDRCQPIRIHSINYNIDKVECSQTHVMAIDCQKHCWCWGDNRFGQVDGNITNICYCSPKLIRFQDDSKIIDIACCETASLALTEHNFLYIWGKLDNCIVSRPLRIDLMNNMRVKKLLGMSKAFAVLTYDCRVILIRQKKERYNRNLFQQMIQFLTKCLDESLPCSVIDIYGSLTYDTCNFILLTETGCCFVWDMIKSNAIRTSMTSIPDVAALHTCYYTNIHAEIPPELVTNGSLILLGTFNNEFQSDLCIKTYTYSHFVRKIFVQQRKLEEHSEYLRQLCLNRIEDDSEEACGRRLIIRRHTYLIVYAYVRYIYTGILRIDPLYTAELYDFAHEFEDNQLIQLIPEFLYHQTNLCSF
ncbi:RCC1 and BTB domain-containing protein 1-like [Dermatophagoides pteronyssinus]|uniref:BTB domain-containing protein n=1 Tax=Dermatophagoides pteronyssinus TaxID=6956 RepID=A0ABQ8JF37_DERPT|nr:hypothetical protein DERP_001510 [Dermatophagoides pteronyssinus]